MSPWSQVQLTEMSRHITRNVMRVGALFATVMLALSIGSMLRSDSQSTADAASVAPLGRSVVIDSVLDTLPDTIPATVPGTVPETTTPSTTTPATTTTIAETLTPTTELPVESGVPTPHLPRTGSSSSPAIAIWAIMLLVFGRMAILFARPVQVRTNDSR